MEPITFIILLVVGGCLLLIGLGLLFSYGIYKWRQYHSEQSSEKQGVTGASNEQTQGIANTVKTHANPINAYTSGRVSTEGPSIVNNASKILMFDHGGVLDSAMSMTANDNDLVLSIVDGYKSILINGVLIVKRLNELVDQHNYQIVFHSKNSEEDQLRIWQQLQRACQAKGLPFPKVIAMAVFNANQYSGIASDNPKIETKGDYQIAGYGIDKNDKACVRQALVTLLGISEERYKDCIVFDDGDNIIAKARKEGYEAYCIGEGDGKVSLHKAIEDIYQRATSTKTNNEQQHNYRV